ncbi:hypothetical protein AGLY_009671 [Aphis glycines]|uniref:Uncharacterized protein n=1 Tax=Aphis glycines TaxID=307491 RepID=A0A6G0TGP3_APHGL|nr:hypothetical protein AGLY_009671 [Aphis glycines]
MDLTIVDDPITYLCNASRSFALLNNLYAFKKLFTGIAQRIHDQAMVNSTRSGFLFRSRLFHYTVNNYDNEEVRCVAGWNYNRRSILAYEMYVVKCLYNEVRLQNMSVFDPFNFTSMRHSAQSTYQSSHLAAIYSTMALMWYFLWIFFILRKRMNPKQPNNMSIQDRTLNTGNKDYTSVYCT